MIQILCQTLVLNSVHLIQFKNYISWSQFFSSAVLKNMARTLLWSYLCCYVCPRWGFPLGSGWFQLWGRWVEVLCFRARPDGRQRKVRRPFSTSANNAGELRTLPANRVLTHSVFWAQTASLVTFDVLPLSQMHHTYAGQPTASSFYCLPALKSRPSVQLYMGSVPIYNRGMGAREGFLLSHCHYFPALPSFIHWPLLYFLFVQ